MRRQILTIFGKRDDFQHLTILGKYLKRNIHFPVKHVYLHWHVQQSSIEPDGPPLITNVD